MVDFGDPLKDLRERRKDAPTVGIERNPRDPGSGGIYTPAVIIGSTDMDSVLPRVRGN
jgi:hypothetical protein